MYKFFFILTFLYIFLIMPVQAQWELNTNGLPSWHVADAIDACDSLTAVVSVRLDSLPHSPFLTKDGGNSWDLIPIPNQWGAVDVSIVDSNFIWACTGDGEIFATIDGGQNWTLQFYDSTQTQFMNYIEMFDLNNGIAMGDGLTHADSPAVFLKTIDGGSTWISTNDSAFGAISYYTWRMLDFVNPDTGYFFETGVAPYKMYRTMDGGYSWSVTGFSGFPGVIKFYNSNIGLAIEFPGPSRIYRTLNGAVSWEYFSYPEDFGSDIDFIPGDVSKVWSCGDKLYFSQDTGKTWTEDSSVGNIFGRDIVFTDENHGWLLCDDGLLYHTTTGGGMTNIKDDDFKLTTEFRLEQNYPNPFNPTTNIEFYIPKTEHVTLKIYDLLGREVTTLISDRMIKGKHEVTWNALDFSSGIYFYTIAAGDFKQTRKLVLMK